ncbi:YveK family protein [Listeria booriae]|uniref:YveK family protein n=1 Tax=Listeria booriae TaxID=1552123 RepID=UPI00162A5DF0|nr:Wzz/FepE/Etk N-terminal domain-containing protein [Listeria booriae]MBC2161738.1 hypothetical protein [Listeria booriae]
MTKISFSDLGKVIKKYIVILMCIPILSTGLVYTTEKVLLPQEYTASTQLLITADNKSEDGQSFDDLRSSIQLIGTFSTTIQSDKVKKEVAEDLGIEKIDENITVITDQNSLYFTVNVTGPNEEEAVDVANSLSKVVTKDFPELFSGMSVHVMEKASDATPKPMTFQLILGFISGLMASIILAFSILLFSSIITKESQLRDLGLTVLGDTPFKNLRKEDFKK